MAFTATDLAKVEQAMVDLAIGKRVVEVDVGGKTRRFQATSMDKLKKLRNLIQAEVNNATNGTGFMQPVSFKDPS